MRANSLFGLMCSLTLVMCLVFPATAEQPGDKLLEVFKKDIAPEESLIPEGVTIVDTFQPGTGDPIGTVSVIDGRVLAIHRNGKTAYPLQKDSPLFTHDTLITEKQSKAGIEFKDGSFISLGTYTKLVLDKSVFDPSESTRDSFLRLLFGKARFIVTKLAEYRSAKYQVKTPTAVVGVRGSDFAVAVAHSSPLTTTVATNEGTSILVAGDIGPAQIMGPAREVCLTPAGASTSIPVPSSYYPSEGFLPRGTKQVKTPDDSAQKQAPKKPLYKDPLAWGVGIGAGAAIWLGGSSGDNGGSNDLRVTANPAAGATATIGVPFQVIFDFTKPINPVSLINFSVTSPWVLAIVNQTSTQVIVEISVSTAAPNPTISLLNITGIDSSVLQPPTTFAYAAG